MSRPDTVCMRCHAQEAPQDAELKHWRVVLAMTRKEPAGKPIAVTVRPYRAETRAYVVDDEVRAVTGVLCPECMDKEVGELMEREAELRKAGDELLELLELARKGPVRAAQKFARVLYLREDPSARADKSIAVKEAGP